jgi:hypothetical protein
VRFDHHSLELLLTEFTAQVMETHASLNVAAHLNCSSCDAIIGALDATTSSYKLSKLALSISHKDDDKKQSFDATKWLSCHLLNSMDNQGLRKFVVTADPGSKPSLLIWLFAPDLNIASSATAHDTPLRVTKILWKSAPAQRQDTLLDKQSMTEGEIEVPGFEFEGLKCSLDQSAKLLPESARRFQDWNVALLERFVVGNGKLQ